MMFLKNFLLASMLSLALISPSPKHSADPATVQMKKGDLNELTFKDTAGNLVSLSAFEGKVVHIDLWASWCRPCLAEFPATKRLQDDLKNEDIAWVFISMDKDEDAWRAGLAKQQGVRGINLLATEKSKQYFKSDLGVGSIPFYIWLDRKGKIAKFDAPRPSEDPKTKLEKLARD